MADCMGRMLLQLSGPYFVPPHLPCIRVVTTYPHRLGAPLAPAVGLAVSGGGSSSILRTVLNSIDW